MQRFVFNPHRQRLATGLAAALRKLGIAGCRRVIIGGSFVTTKSYKTVYNWLNRWESEEMVGLCNQPGRGIKRTFNSEQSEKIRGWARQEPRQLKQVVQKVKAEWDIEISTKTIKRILKAFSMSWHRMRRCVRGEPDPA